VKINSEGLFLKKRELTELKGENILPNSRNFRPFAFHLNIRNSLHLIMLRTLLIFSHLFEVYFDILASTLALEYFFGKRKLQ